MGKKRVEMAWKRLIAGIAAGWLLYAAGPTDKNISTQKIQKSPKITHLSKSVKRGERCWRYDPSSFKIWRSKKISRKRAKKIYTKAKSMFLCLPKGVFVEDEPLRMIVKTIDDTVYAQNKIVCSHLEKGSRKCRVLDDESHMEIDGKMGLKNMKLNFATIDHYALRKVVLGMESTSMKKSVPGQRVQTPVKRREHFVCFEEIDKKSRRYMGCVSSSRSCYSRKLLLYGYYASDRETPLALEECRKYVEE